MASVRLDGLVKAFGATRAVDGVSLDIPDGEFVVFVGPSGCGKTTTLNIVAGLETPTAGDVWIGGDRVTDWEPRDRNIGMVFQSLALFPHMTVFDNIAFPLRIKRVAPPEIDIRSARSATPSTSGTCSTSGRPPCRAAKPSGWPWRARWSCSPASS